MTSERKGLLDLPNEILFAIWEEVQIDAINSFASTCRHLRLLAGEILEKHQRWRITHSQSSLGDYPPSTFIRYYCIEAKQVALYPKRLTIAPQRSWATTYNEDDHYALRRISLMPYEHGDSFEKIFSLINLLGEEKLDGVLTAILAWCLPNLKAIFYVEDCLEGVDLENFVDGLIKGMTELTKVPENPQQAFPCLSHISITRVHWRRFPAELEPFLPLLALPNLRSFEESGYSYGQFDVLPFPPRTSKVETLDISPQVYSKTSVLTLLSAFEALKSFKLRSGQWNFRQGSGFFPLLNACLLKYFQSTLQRLEVHDYIAYRQFFGSLRPFSVLKSVVIQPDLLLPDFKDVMPRLIDFFPSSIEEIRFTRNLTETHERQFFAGFFDDREKTMPNLRLVISCQLLNWRYKEDRQPGGQYRFRYITYRDDTVVIRFIDTDASSSQLRVFQLSTENLNNDER